MLMGTNTSAFRFLNIPTFDYHHNEAYFKVDQMPRFIEHTAESFAVRERLLLSHRVALRS